MRTRLQELLFSSHLDVQAFGTGENSPSTQVQHEKNESKMGFFWGTIYRQKITGSRFPFPTEENTNIPPSPPAHPREECSPRCSAHWSADQRRSTWRRITKASWLNPWHEDSPSGLEKHVVKRIGQSAYRLVKFTSLQ